MLAVARAGVRLNPGDRRPELSPVTSKAAIS